MKKKLEELGAVVDLYDARANINSFEKTLRKVNDKYYFTRSNGDSTKTFKSKIERKNMIIYSPMTFWMKK